jgi:ribosome biogenesis GTPase
VAEADTSIVPAVVVAVGGGLAAVRTDADERVAKLAGRLRARPVVGDRVGVLLQPDGGARIDRIEPRATTLARLQRLGRGDQVLVANAAVLAVVAAVAEPPLRRGLVDRLLVAAWAGGMDAVLVLTKADLAALAADPPAAVLHDYDALGYPGVAVDARAPAGADEVLELLGGRTAVLAGHSGVGKSTLVNALTAGAQLTGAVNAVIGRGRHTTTAARMLQTIGGTTIVDTPGIRGFALTGIAEHELGHAFPEIAAAAPDCRYGSCLHRGEPGCAVAGRIDPRRLASYRKLLGELRGEEPAGS